MYRWLAFIAVLTLGTVIYHYPALYHGLAERVPVWLGLTSEDVLYRWQDRHGQWQVSETPPKQGIPFEKLKIRHGSQAVNVTEQVNAKDATGRP